MPRGRSLSARRDYVEAAGLRSCCVWKGRVGRRTGENDMASGAVHPQVVLFAGMAELVDATDLKSVGAHAPCGFESHSRY